MFFIKNGCAIFYLMLCLPYQAISTDLLHTTVKQIEFKKVSNVALYSSSYTLIFKVGLPIDFNLNAEEIIGTSTDTHINVISDNNMPEIIDELIARLDSKQNDLPIAGYTFLEYTTQKYIMTVQDDEKSGAQKLNDNFSVENIVSRCHNKQFPSAVIDPAEVTRQLVTLEKNLLHSSSYRLALSNKMEHIELPLSSCFFSDKNLLILMNVPLVASYKIFEMFQPIRIRLTFPNRLCSIPTTNNYVAVSGDMINIIFDQEIEKRISHSNASFLYHLPSVDYISNRLTECIKKAFTENDLESIRKYCEFLCSDEMVDYKQINSSTVKVSNAQTVRYRCTRYPFEIDKTVPFTEPTSVYIVSSGCSCFIEINDQIFIGSKVCSHDEIVNVPTLKIVVPDADYEISLNFSNESYVTRLPVKDNFVLMIPANSPIDSTTLQCIWISAAIIMLFFIIYCANSKKTIRIYCGQSNVRSEVV